MSEIRLVSVNPNAKVAHIPVQKVQDTSAPWRPRHELDLSLSYRGIDPGPVGVPCVSGIKVLAVDPLSPAVVRWGLCGSDLFWHIPCLIVLGFRQFGCQMYT